MSFWSIHIDYSGIICERYKFFQKPTGRQNYQISLRIRFFETQKDIKLYDKNVEPKIKSRYTFDHLQKS